MSVRQCPVEDPITKGAEMLVLSRKAGETITIGDGITVSVIRLEGGRVRLGVDAPKNVRIIRGELEKWLSAPQEESELSEQAASN
jgi:carbon storage regulator